MFTDLVYIGRFQPLHNEHLRVIERALELSERVVIVLGSCNVPQSAKNPFTVSEREQFILNSVSAPERIRFVESNDYPYDWSQWELDIILDVEHQVLADINNNMPVYLHGLNEAKIGILCPRKDEETSEYLDLFKRWEHVEVPVEATTNATDIRKVIYGEEIPADEDYVDFLHRELPPYVAEYILQLEDSARLSKLSKEYGYIERSKAAWANSPFPPMFITVDNVITHRGKVLLVTRGGYPGNGLLALPGGFHEVGQTLWHSALRELREETTLEGVETYFVKSKVFDAPSRSQLGAMVTHAFYFKLPDELEVPLVKGEDDAVHADWYSIEDLDPTQLHDDHYWIIKEAILG